MRQLRDSRGNPLKWTRRFYARGEDLKRRVYKPDVQDEVRLDMFLSTSWLPDDVVVLLLGDIFLLQGSIEEAVHEYIRWRNDLEGYTFKKPRIVPGAVEFDVVIAGEKNRVGVVALPFGTIASLRDFLDTFAIPPFKLDEHIITLVTERELRNEKNGRNGYAVRKN